MTVHDLVNPHFVDQTPTPEHLDVLIPAATEVITLTPGAAAAIETRWGRPAAVIPHPHVVPLDRVPAPPRDPVRRPGIRHRSPCQEPAGQYRSAAGAGRTRGGIA